MSHGYQFLITLTKKCVFFGRVYVQCFSVLFSADETIYLSVFYVCHWMSMSICLLDPIIFSFFNDKFRVSTSKGQNTTKIR